MNGRRYKRILLLFFICIAAIYSDLKGQLPNGTKTVKKFAVVVGR